MQELLGIVLRLLGFLGEAIALLVLASAACGEPEQHHEVRLLERQGFFDLLRRRRAGHGAVRRIFRD